MIESISAFDLEAFILVNAFHSPFWDKVMIAFSSLALWFPLYGFLLLIGFKKYGFMVWRLVLAAALVVALADQVSSSFLKPKIARLRPCHDETINQQVHQPGGCGGKFGFVSSHAANTFGVATLIVMLWGTKWAWLWLWSLLVCYSRVYLGVHYPIDVLSGAALGAIMAVLVWLFYYRVLLKSQFSTKETA